MLRHPRTTACTVLALVAILTPFSLSAQPGGPPASVVVDEARLETIHQYREVVGELRAIRRALLAAEDEGLIIELGLQEGDSVAAGQVVARLRDARAAMEVRRVRADLAAHEAAIAERTADLERARRDLARIDELQLRGSAAQTELEDRRTAASIANARLEHARAERDAAAATLDLAMDRLDRRTVTAPFAGVVVSKRTEVGQWARQGDPIIELVALDQLEARLHVPESLIGTLHQSGTSSSDVRIRITATGEVVSAPIVGIVPDVDPLSRLIPIRMRLDNPDHHLRPGMSIAGLVPTGTREPSLTIHKDAIRRDDAGEFVYFDAGGTAAAARIHSVLPIGDRVVIRSTMLRPGMAVVTEGNERLNPGRPLNILSKRGGAVGRDGAGEEGGEAAPAAATPGEARTPEGRGR